MEDFFRVTKDTVLIDLKVTPGASRNEFAGVREGRMVVRIAAPPEDGKANARLCEFLAKAFDCPKRDVVLIKGEKSKLKTVSVPAACGEKLCRCFSGDASGDAAIETFPFFE